MPGMNSSRQAPPLKTRREFLKNTFKDQVDVPEDRQYIGFDGYQNAMDRLKNGDIAILATPPAFRWVHFKYAIKYTYADGSKFYFYGRTMLGCYDKFSSIAHGAKGMATISLGSHSLAKAGRIYKGQQVKSEDEVWAAFPQANAPDPYEMEW